MLAVRHDNGDRLSWPDVTVIVAVYNEAETIAGKLRELDAIDYPDAHLHILVVDGGSSDGTAAVVRAFTAGHRRVTPIFTTFANRTAQINEALARGRGGWVLMTDADARMPKDTLRRLVSAALTDGAIAVVGTPVVPAEPHPLDLWHWRLSNLARRAEWRLGTTGLVVGPCYLFRRDLLGRFPVDSTADDVFTACQAAAVGARVALVDAQVRELRVATDVSTWFRQKLRRTLGYLREVIRFVPTSVRMRSPMREVFLWRALALLAGPVAITAATIVATSVVGWLLPATGVAVALAGGAIRQLPRRGRPLADAVLVTALPFWLLAVTSTALLLYPFVRPSMHTIKATLRSSEVEVC